jgi:hypothetical protein
MKLLDWMKKKWNRQSPIVFLLTGMLGLSALLIPVFGAIKIFERSNIPEEREKIFAFNWEDVCASPK